MGDEPPLLARLSARCRLSFVFIWSGFYCSYSSAFSSFSRSLSFNREGMQGVRTDRKSDNHRPLRLASSRNEPFVLEGDSFSHSRTRGTRINVCSRHRKYLSDMRYTVSNPLEGRQRILTLRRTALYLHVSINLFP